MYIYVCALCRALPAARRRRPAAPPPAARCRTPERGRAHRDPRDRAAVRRLASSGAVEGSRARRGAREAVATPSSALAPAVRADGNGFGPLWALLAPVRADGGTPEGAPTSRGSRKCAACGRRTSTRTARPTSERQLVPGRSWAAWARALGHLLPPLEVADLGCGEGYLTIEASRWAKRVIAVDRSRDVLKRARSLARARRQQHHLEAGRAGEAAARGRQRGRGAAVAGAASCGRSARALAEAADRRPRRPRARAGPARARRAVGARAAWRQVARLRRRRGSRLALPKAGLADVKVTSARGAPAIRSPC